MQHCVESLQRTFFERCRSIYSPDRMKVYSEAIYNNVEETLTFAYPITLALLTNKEWQKLTKDFFAYHPCRTPIFREMPKELMLFAKEKRYDLIFNRPYLLDLLEFEWVEIEIYNMKDLPIEPFLLGKELLDHPLYFNPEQRLLDFSYPVFKNFKELASSSKGNYPLLCFRHAETKQVHFIQLSLFFAATITLMQQEVIDARKALLITADAFRIANKQRALDSGKHFFSDLFRSGAILGFIQ